VAGGDQLGIEQDQIEDDQPGGIVSSELESFLGQRTGASANDWAVQTAMSHGMNSIGEARGLPPLHWTAINEDGGVLEGRPVDGCSSVESVCEAWASELGFTEFSFDVGNGIRSWYLINSTWHIEISTETGDDWLSELD